MSRRRAPWILLALVACAAPPASDSRPATESRPAESSEGPGASPTLAKILERAYAHIEATTSRAELEASLKALTAKPHLAGSAAGRETAAFVEGRFTLAGLETRREEFEVLLPYPEEVVVELLRPYAYRAPLAETPLDRDFDTHAADVVPPYLAYAADGDVTGALVYANYGRAEDYERLAAAGVECRGRIVLVRYGKTYRGSKALEAAHRGALAMLLYSDPADDGFTKGPETPEGPWRPKTAIQRGSVLDIALRPGDPLTPDAPALPGALRLALEDAETLPHIPVVALSWGDAEPMLKLLDGPAAPEGWQGGLPFAYRLGGGRATAARVALKSDWKRRTIVNVFGSIRGGLRPDEEVLIGGHRDAWVHGAVDPCGGQAALIEAARVLGELARKGIRPSRTITFCSWDGEEFGLLGSTEHVEGARTRLLESCVVYLNADASVSGDKFTATASPELRPLVRGALGALADDRSPAGAAARPSLWTTSLKTGGVRFDLPGGGSDHASFVALLGAPTVEFGSGGPYGVYHSLYDTFGWMKRHGDPDFSRHARVAKAIAAFAITAASETILSVDAAGLARRLDAEADAFAARTGLDVSGLKGALAAAARAGDRLSDARRAALAKDPDPLRLATVNKRLIGAARAFLAERPLKRRPFYRNVLLAVDPSNGYAPLAFPGAVEALADGDRAAAVAALAAVAAAVEEWRRRLEVVVALLEPLG